MIGRDLLIKNKELAKWWVQITHDERFDQVIALVLAELAESCNSWERLRGGNESLNLLKRITDNQDCGKVYPSAKLDHRTVDQIRSAPVQPQAIMLGTKTK